MDDTESPTRCGVGIRGVAMTIDAFVWIALAIASVFAVGAASGQLERSATGVEASLEGTLAAIGLALWLGLSISYHALAEWQFGKTLGKYLVGIRVVNADGSTPSLWTLYVRNTLRLVDWLPGFYILGIGSVILSDQNQRLGDWIAGTAVVRS